MTEGSHGHYFDDARVVIDWDRAFDDESDLQRAGSIESCNEFTYCAEREFPFTEYEEEEMRVANRYADVVCEDYTAEDIARDYPEPLFGIYSGFSLATLTDEEELLEEDFVEDDEDDDDEDDDWEDWGADDIDIDIDEDEDEDL
jgi:hypothetical protein